jgi:hypothetical protein
MPECNINLPLDKFKNYAIRNVSKSIRLCEFSVFASRNCTPKFLNKKETLKTMLSLFALQSLFEVFLHSFIPPEFEGIDRTTSSPGLFTRGKKFTVLTE